MFFNMNVAVAFTFKDQLQTKLKNQQDALRNSSFISPAGVNTSFVYLCERV